MQAPYKTVTVEVVERIVSLCQKYTIANGGILEIYDDPGGINRIMIIINGISGKKLKKLNPIGAFFCNYTAPGVISIDENPDHDETKDKKIYRSIIKKTIDELLKGGFPDPSDFHLD